ncbi:hypothetical protein AAFC00_005801 [Neodothiora populina]|uniref:Carrier domain-containing protein n=1 Tax=Neodothiora populina TaxID=2781224 RepID=A0ABR3P678_9PEZI
MAPIAVADLESSASHIENVSDTSVFPSENADSRLKKLWAQHGDIQSSKYLDANLTSLPRLIKFNARTRPDELAYLVPRDDIFASITWEQFDHLTEYVAAQYSQAFQGELETSLSMNQQPTLALLGSGNTFRYWVSQVALLKLGVRVLLLSDKNAEVARDHLMRVCNAVGVVVEQKYVRHVQGLQVPIVPFVPVSLEWDPKPVSEYVRFESDDEWNQQTMIIHSSGSTGLPKPIIHTNRSIMLIARMYRLFQSFIVENWYLCFPLFHIAGVSIILGGVPTALPTTFPPETWPPSPGAILGAWRKLEQVGRPVDCLHCAPSVIEDLYEYITLSAEKDFSPLSKLKVLQPGGAALSPTMLQNLEKLKVNVKTTYGSTEIGPPYRTIPDTLEGSCYRVKSLFPNDARVVMEPQGENLYECVIYKGFPLAAELWLDSQAPDPYRTNDLFIQDPPNSGLYMLQGRKDDMLVHSNGEKTNALPLQMAIEECHPAIKKIIVFGTSKPCTSAVVELSKAQGHSDVEPILVAMEAACEAFPSFSRLNRSLILFLKDGETLPVTPKGNVRRNEAKSLYGGQVEELYAKVFDDVDESGEDEKSARLDDLAFVRHAVASACGLSVERVQSSTSFYEIGLDSQKAVKLRSSLSKRFGKFPMMLIFEHPSPQSLSQRLGQSTMADTAATANKNICWIRDTISNYNAVIESWAGESQPRTFDQSSAEVVYLTGATGAIGNALLAALDADPKVSKVYCAIRGSNGRKRLTEALQTRGYANAISTSGKFVVVPCDMRDAKLGLDDETHQQLAGEVTAVMHNAWRLDFNQQVDMFEDDCLKSTLNLMHFAYTTKKKTFAFTSSVATNMGKSSAGKIIHETPIVNNPSLALETGYAQSKFIIEVVSQTYSRVLDMPVRIYRVGQLCGHTVLGAWNTSEMFPIMIATGLQHLKAMPVFGEKSLVNWLPVDICAESIRATLLNRDLAETDKYTLHNLVNPSTITWAQFLDALEQASETAFDRVSMSEWVARLQVACEVKGGDVPGAKLLGFFESMARAADEDAAVFETEKTTALVPRLRDAPAVDTDLLNLYLSKWRQVGFM